MRYLRVLAVLATLMPAAVAAQLNSYPDHAVRFVVPFTPGGNADVVARTLAQGLTEQLKQSVIVENRPGANAMIGAQAVARAAPDGYTLLLATAESHAINPHIYKKVNYDAVNDFAAIGVNGSATMQKRVSRHRLEEGVVVLSRSVLNGLHHEYLIASVTV